MQVALGIGEEILWSLRYARYTCGIRASGECDRSIPARTHGLHKTSHSATPESRILNHNDRAGTNISWDPQGLSPMSPKIRLVAGYPEWLSVNGFSLRYGLVFVGVRCIHPNLRGLLPPQLQQSVLILSGLLNWDNLHAIRHQHGRTYRARRKWK